MIDVSFKEKIPSKYPNKNDAMRGGICARADLVAASWVINTDGDISLNIALHIALHNPTFNFIVDRTMVGKCSSIILRRGIYYFF